MTDSSVSFSYRLPRLAEEGEDASVSGSSPFGSHRTSVTDARTSVTDGSMYRKINGYFNYQAQLQRKVRHRHSVKGGHGGLGTGRNVSFKNSPDFMEMNREIDEDSGFTGDHQDMRLDLPEEEIIGEVKWSRVYVYPIMSSC